MLALLSAFGVSLGATLIVIHFSNTSGRFALDHDFSGPQKFHSRPVPRVGGIGIVVGLVAVDCMLWMTEPEWGRAAMWLLLCGVPAFGVGLVEDLTKRVSPAKRLGATAISAALCAALLDAVMKRADIPGIDALMTIPAGALLLTIFTVAGVANAVNIIDGFNGLASMCVVLMLASTAYVALQVGDGLVLTLALAGIGAVLGFFIWNFPGGLIFLGDGGAYFLGFYVAETAILLLVRNPQVSPLFAVLVCFYPIFETLFSIYRRRFLRATPPGLPDGIHLHSLIYRRVVRWAVGTSSAKALTRRNSMTSPFLWLLCMLSIIPAMLWWQYSAVLAGFIVLFGVTYIGLYWRIVRFRAPRWMRALATRPAELRPPGGS